MEVKIKDLRIGDLFTLKNCEHLDEVPEHLIYIRGAFERSIKKFSVISYVDSCKESFKKGSQIVYVL